MRSPHVGDIGTPFTLTIYGSNNEILDISSASPITIYLIKPDDTKLEKEATLVTDGTDGMMQYIIETGDLDTAGDWRIQGKVVFTNGTWSTDVLGFVVEANE